MLTSLASESTLPTFVTFPPQVLSTGERRAWLWFPCTRLSGSNCCSLSCHPCSSPTGFPAALARLENAHMSFGLAGRHPHPPSPLLCHQPGKGDSAWEQGWLTLMLLSHLRSQPQSPRSFEEISNSMRMGVKSQLLAKVWLLSYFKGPEVRLAGPLACWWLQCQHR